MRLWHLFLAIFVVATVLAIARDTVGRVALVVFVTGLIEIVCGMTAIMALFQTIGSMGQATRPAPFAIAFAATTLVLVVSSLVMNTVLWFGVSLVQQAVR